MPPAPVSSRGRRPGRPSRPSRARRRSPPPGLPPPSSRQPRSDVSCDPRLRLQGREGANPRPRSTTSETCCDDKAGRPRRRRTSGGRSSVIPRSWNPGSTSATWPSIGRLPAGRAALSGGVGPLARRCDGTLRPGAGVPRAQSHPITAPPPRGPHSQVYTCGSHASYTSPRMDAADVSTFSIRTVRACASWTESSIAMICVRSTPL
jgi:hypothetical protein